MITERVGDLLAQADLTHIAHQANLYHAFGAGLARAIAETHPYAEAADARTPHGDPAKLGTYSAGVDPAAVGPIVINLYSQHRDDGAGNHTDYDALRAALTALEGELRGHPGARLGLPYYLGCGIAGGSWAKVYGVVEAVFARSPVDVVVVRLPETLN